MTDKPLLQVRNLTTQIATDHGAVNVIDDVSFELNMGETLGIIGESGSGKSMTALSILRLLPEPVASTVGGQILFGGQDLLQKSDAEMRMIRGREIGLIPQDPHTSLNPVFTIANQLAEALKLQDPGASRETLRQRSIEALKSVRVAAPEHRLNAYPHEMSGGMKQRVVGAIALCGKPRIIIADEPTTALDVTIQLQYLQLLQSIQDDTGMGIIFITHDFGIVLKLCHRVAVMYGGRIVETGRTLDVFNNPSHPYTRALLQSVPTMDNKADRLFAIRGQPPMLHDVTEGCRFAARCDHADLRCQTEVPRSFGAQSASGTEHLAACWQLEEQA